MAAAMTGDARWWHGGAPGLRPGDLIEPTTGTRHLVDGCKECEARRHGGTLMHDAGPRPDRVYLTRDRDYARIYANGYPRGALYTAEPLGELEPTTGLDPVPSFAATAARILSVYDPCVTMTLKEIRRSMRRYGVDENEVRRTYIEGRP
jgi:hypothetical protein